MPLPQWIWKPDRAGAIAMANLIAVEICLLAILAFRDASFLHNEVGDIVGSVTAICLLVLLFPLGWLGEVFFGGIHLPPLHAFVTVPLNAYLWGGLLEQHLQHRAETRRIGLPSESPSESVDQGHERTGSDD